MEPPVRRYTGPIVDAHVHVDDVEAARLLVRVAKDFGVAALCGVVRAEAIEALGREFADALRPIVRIDHTHLDRPDRFVRDNIQAVRQARAGGAVAAKFWYSPRFVAETRFGFDHPSLRPVLETLVELDMAALVHVADPDAWFQTHYADTDRYGTKEAHYAALEHTLAAYPALKVLGAHFAGDPEDLGHVRRLLDAYPNLAIDSSATKWIARELSRQPEESRAFLIERADRILFGTDLVAFQGGTAEHYASRYWVHRWLWEGTGPRPSPIPDPCAPWPDGPRVHGLALPDDVLAQLYRDNARQFLGVET